LEAQSKAELDYLAQEEKMLIILASEKVIYNEEFQKLQADLNEVMEF